MTQTATAAEQYAALKEGKFETFLAESFSSQALKKTPLFEVTVPSGMTFKCRKPDGSYVLNAGNLPVGLSAQMLTEGQDKPEDVIARMTPIEARAAIQATAQLVRYVCVSPRLVVGELNGQRDAISVEALTVSDFNHIAIWAQGGGAAEGLKTFRRKRR